jgi:hypothetical protein
MKILAMEMDRPSAKGESFRALAKEEAARAWELYQAGIIRELYFREDRSQAVLVLECSGVEEAALLLATLPYVRERLIDFELIPLVPYPGFGRLFDATL